jgi:hypothetical protein
MSVTILNEEIADLLQGYNRANGQRKQKPRCFELPSKNSAWISETP